MFRPLCLLFYFLAWENYAIIWLFLGSSGSSAVLTTFCGTGNEQFISSGTSVYVEFKTNNLINKKGFRLRYYSAKGKRHTSFCLPLRNLLIALLTRKKWHLGGFTFIVIKLLSV